MATVTKSLNSMYKQAMHRPVSTDGFVLYTKLNSNDASEGESAAEKSEIFKKQSQVNYNSPTNIRKVFITGKGIAVQYYATPVTANNSGKRWGYKAFDDNLFTIAEKKLTYNSDISMYNMSKVSGMKAEEPIKYKVEGNGIGVISGLWVCNNIEEIYFDWTMLISNDVGPYFQEYSTAEGYTGFITRKEPSAEIKYDTLKKFFMDFNSGGVKDLRKRFPRLKFIAMISRLHDVIEHQEMVKVDLEFNNVVESTKTWYEVNRNLIGKSGSLVLYSDLSADLSKPNKEFNIKSSQYKFDYDKLDSAIKLYLTKITDLTRQKYGSAATDDTDTDTDTQDIDIDLPEVEKRLLEIEQEYGESTLKNVLLFTTRGTNIKLSKIKTIMEEFSKPNRIRMMKMIGFTDVK